MITKTIDGVSFELKEDFDFDFLSSYGNVFAVFDKQDSGYICFGVQNENRKLFLKVAGASTMRSHVSQEEAIARLKSTVPIYEDLAHPSLLPIIEHKEINAGFVTVFEWFEGECMGKQYEAHAKFADLPIGEKEKLYREIVRFHVHVHKCGYIAIDFYDGCMMYNFDTKQTRLCDVELYSKMPVINTMGRMWGSSRFMSPEEFQLGAHIDERSNVYTMGATAFQLFGGGTDRSFDQWKAGAELYAFALKAVSKEKEDRYPTIEEYFSDFFEKIPESSIVSQTEKNRQGDLP
ncbi:serine/threonine-protein kinase [Paenibacillus ginsengarvi]|uniref:Serine/threonine protein kinase n=1 Tax=Paenibacillus ginsengarvi TaxID=400777 RepID=A0A3B0BR55_9BACL|nr:serine/threonine-protein kinase [Paenibacillus ginsengarvi]RKN75785.1 serine/threonine protein kinase [Paenibacillus ginsengarvi]